MSESPRSTHDRSSPGSARRFATPYGGDGSGDDGGRDRPRKPPTTPTRSRPMIEPVPMARTTGTTTIPMEVRMGRPRGSTGAPVGTFGTTGGTDDTGGTFRHDHRSTTGRTTTGTTTGPQFGHRKTGNHHREPPGRQQERCTTTGTSGVDKQGRGTTTRNHRFDNREPIDRYHRLDRAEPTAPRPPRERRNGSTMGSTFGETTSGSNRTHRVQYPGLRTGMFPRRASTGRRATKRSRGTGLPSRRLG